MKVQQTANYSVFKTHNCNRKLHEGNLKRLESSIKKANLLKSRPILVDKEFRIVDGQHRLEVAKRLGIPVFYQVHEGKGLDDILLLNNNQRNWSLIDYLNYYCTVDDYPEYRKLKEFVEESNIDLNVAIQLLNGNRSGGFYRKFKDGLYEFPDINEFNESLMKKIMINQTIDFIKSKTSGNKIYLAKVTFYSALVDLFSLNGFSYDLFMKKIQYKTELMHPCSKKNEYLKILLDIYNWKNRCPIRIYN